MARWSGRRLLGVGALVALLLGQACAAFVSPDPTPRPWPTAPQPRRTPLPLPEPTESPPTATPTATRGPADFVGKKRVRVLRVWDGQSVLIEDGLTVRYLGIQAQGGGAFGRPVTPLGAAAAQRNAELVEGREVELEQDTTDVDTDGQLPRYVWVDGVLVNRLLVQEGLAQVAVKEPDTRYAEDLLAAEREALEARRGVWVNAPTLTRTPIVRPRATFRPTATPAPSPTPTIDRPAAPRFGAPSPTRVPTPGVTPPTSGPTPTGAPPTPAPTRAPGAPPPTVPAGPTAASDEAPPFGGP